MGYKVLTERNIKKIIASHNIKTVLDVGCGSRQYEKLFADQRYIGIDVPISGRQQSQKSPDVYYDGVNFPFPDSNFDLTLCTEVLEHCLEPELLVKEISRVTKDGGVVYITTPFIHGEHEAPFDFRRFTSFGMIKIIEDHGLSITDLSKEVVGYEAFAYLSLKSLKKRFPQKGKSIRYQICKKSLHFTNFIFRFMRANTDDIYLTNHLIAVKIG